MKPSLKFSEFKSKIGQNMHFSEYMLCNLPCCILKNTIKSLKIPHIYSSISCKFEKSFPMSIMLQQCKCTMKYLILDLIRRLYFSHISFILKATYFKLHT